MTEPNDTERKDLNDEDARDVFVVTCVSGFDQIANARSAFMFATLAAVDEFETIVFLTQHGVDLVVKDAIEKREKPTPGTPTLRQRLEEALEMGVRIEVCSQAVENKKLTIDDLIPEVTIEGGMHLIDLSAGAKGVLCF